MSQKSDILAYLGAGNTLTGRDSRRLFQCDRLASRVHELRKDGHNITSEMIAAPGGKWVARYKMERSNVSGIPLRLRHPCSMRSTT